MGSGQYLLGRQGPRRLPLFGIVLSLMLVACNSNPEPAPLPTEGVTSSATTTPTQSPTPPTMPAEAEGTSKAAAKAFVRHWVKALNYAAASGDTTELDRISSAVCQSCTSIIQKIERVYTNGGYVEGDGWVVESVNVVPAQPAANPVLQVTMFLSVQKIVEAAGQEPQRFKGGKQPMMFSLAALQEGGWHVTRIDEVQ